MSLTPPDPLASSVATRWRVAARSKAADVIGDPRDLLRSFRRVIDFMAEHEALFPTIREMHATISRDPTRYLGGKDANGNRLDVKPEDRKYLWQYKNMLMQLSARLKGSVESFRRAGTDRLFLSLLQQYTFPPALRKKIEAAANVYSKSRVVPPKDLAVVDAYQKALGVHRQYLAVAEEALQKGKPHGLEGTKKWTVGSFELVNTGGFDDVAMERVARLVEQAERLLRAKKLGGVCYGKILVSQKLANNVAAFYMPSQDEMFVRADLKTDDKTLDTVIHELAHRMEETTHKSKASAIATLYKIYKIQHDDTPIRVDSIPFPSPGDEIQIDTKNLWQVEKVIGDQVYLIHDSDPSKTARATVDAWYRMKGAPLRRAKFVTQYAKRSPSENFAVMVALYCMGKLPQDNVADLEPILYG